MLLILRLKLYSLETPLATGSFSTVPIMLPDTVAVVVVVFADVIVDVIVDVDVWVGFIMVEQANTSMTASIKIRHVVIQGTAFFFILNFQFKVITTLS